MVENRICLLDPPHIREDSEEWLTVKVEYRVGIQWRADDLLFDFETCPNYQKVP